MKKILICAAILAVMPALNACGESECQDGKRECVGNLSRTCVQGYWREVVCRDNAPICDAKLGCMKASAVCGNHVVEAGEECDGVIPNDKTCHSLNPKWTGKLACKSDCTIDYHGCIDLECTVNDKQCSGSVLQLCTENGWIDATDCAQTGLVCDPEQKACAAAQ